MAAFLILLKRMIALLFMMVCGYYAYKKKWVSDEGYGDLSRITANILNPLLIINSVIVDTSVTRELLVQNFILVVICYVGLIVVGLILPLALCCKKNERPHYNFMTIFSNVGFMAIPVLNALYGEGATIYIVFYILAYNVLIYTYGIYLCAKTKENGKASFNFKSMLNPGLISCLVAIVIYASGVKVGDPLTSICSYLGNATIPMSMIITGISIAMFPIKEFLADARAYVFSIIKLLVIPIICALIVRGLPLDKMVSHVFVYEMAMPVGSMTLMLMKTDGENEIICSRSIVISTVLSIVTIPFISFFLT